MLSVKNIKLNDSNVATVSLSILSVGVFLNYFDGFLPTSVTPLKIGISTIFAIIVIMRASASRVPENGVVFLLFIILTSPSFFLTDGFLPMFLSFIGYFVLMFIIANIDMTQDKMLTLLRAFYFGGIFLSCLCASDLLVSGAISQFLGVNLFENWYGDYVFLGFEGNPNGLATHLLPVVIISYAFFINNQKKWQSAMHLFACLIACYVLIMTHSRSGFLGASAGIIVTLFFYLKTPQLPRLKAVLLASVLVGFFSLSVFQVDVFSHTTAFVKNIIETQEVSSEVFRQSDVNVEAKGYSIENNKSDSINIRWMTLPHFLNIAWDNLFFGVGFGQSRDLVGRATGHFVGPHNIFLGVLVEYGLIAFCAFGALIIWPLAKGFRYVQTCLHQSDVPLVPICIFSCYISLLIHGMFHKIYVNFTLWLLVAVLMALCSDDSKHKKVIQS